MLRVEDMLLEFNMSALKSTPTLHWERRETDEKELPASEQKASLLENCDGLTERTYVVQKEKLHQVLDEQATRTSGTSSQFCDTSVETLES